MTVELGLLAFESAVRDVWDTYSDGDKIIVNAVGHSRGAIAAMWALSMGMDPDSNYNEMSRLEHDGLIEKINLIVVDPVPGMGMLADDVPAIGRGAYADVDDIGWDKFRLGDWLTRFVGIYAADERSNRFSGLFPLVHNATETLIFSVRGAHQTVVGNRWKGGHAPVNFPAPCLVGDCEYDDKYLQLQVINDVVELTIATLFKSPKWGSLIVWGKRKRLENPFDTESPYQNEKDALFAKITAMNGFEEFETTIYPMMRLSSYFAEVPIVGLPLESVRATGTCQRMEWGPPTGSRCMERVRQSDHRKASLDAMSEIPSLGVELSTLNAWNKIRVLGFGDEDSDGMADPDDNCPFKPNADQADSDANDVGDACEPHMFDDGFEDLP